MTSRRMLKKKVNSVVNDIIEECYSIQMYANGKMDSQTNQIIDEAANLFDELLDRINAARKIDDNKDLHQHFESINSDLDKNSLQLMAKMDKL